jgi:hypothetical protein
MPRKGICFLKWAIGLMLVSVAFAVIPKQRVPIERVQFSAGNLLPASPDIAASSPPYSLSTDQPFRYLGNGSQSIAFESLDGKIVLKFFLVSMIEKQTSFHRLSLIERIPAVQRFVARRKGEHRMKRAHKIMARYVNAYQDLREETALLGLHLAPTQEVYGQVRLFDREGGEHLVDLDGVAFVIQEKVEIAGSALSRMSEGERRVALRAVEELLEACARKGYCDARGGFKLEVNYGFLGSRAVLLDFGNGIFSPEQKLHPEAEIARQKSLLRTWESGKFKSI